MATTEDELKFELLEELYFITSFNELTERIAWDENYEKQFIQMLTNFEVSQYIQTQNDYQKNRVVDLENLARYWYLVTKKGLLMQMGIL